jgi:hypothetical protein
MVDRFVGRYRTIDASSRFAARDVGGATKTLIATYAGDHFVAEREGEELKIYAIGDDGMPGASVVGDTAMIRRMNELNRDRRERRRLGR